MISRKIVVGTANFGTEYGHFSQKKVDKNNIRKILSTSRKNNIYTLDTAQDYKSSEKLLGVIGVNDFNIISKIKVKENTSHSLQVYFKNKVLYSLKKLKIKSLYGLLIRNPVNTILENGKEVLYLANKLKKEGLFKKLGVTIYNPDELDLIFSVFKPDIVQAPYNIFDRRIEVSGWLKKLYVNNVEFHCRSIFLQGLLLKKKNELPEKFYSYKNHWDYYHNWLEKEKISSLEACLSFVANKKEINKIILGIDSENQLNEILSIKTKNLTFPKALTPSKGNLNNPSKW